MKNGIANNAKLSSPVPIRWAIVVTAGSPGIEVIMVSNDDNAILQATGVPMEMKKMKLNKRTMTGNNSIITA
jgi:hypothetical protein